MDNLCSIIGVLENGPAGVTKAALSEIRSADLVIGASRMLQLFSEVIADNAIQRDFTGRLGQVPSWIKQALLLNKSVVVFATGDPLCHGIGQHLCEKLPKESWRIIPNCSTLQIAFARLGLSWQQAKICSIHGKDTGEWTLGNGADHGLYPLLSAIRQNKLLAIFTSPRNSPQRVARMLQLEGLEAEWEVAVAERLLLGQENVHGFMPVADASNIEFAVPNVMLLRRGHNPRYTLFGLADDNYLQRTPDKGLITKREVRAVSLARLQLCRDSTVWDIGAGSGSVGLEAARLCSDGYVYAIEKNAADALIVEQNRCNQKITNYRITQAKAPAEMAQWPAPDAVFIGGSAGNLQQLIKLSLDALNPNGWLVMNFVTLENLNTSIETLKSLNIQWDVTQLQISRNKSILAMQRMQAENPVWIVSAQKGYEE